MNQSFKEIFRKILDLLSQTKNNEVVKNESITEDEKLSQSEIFKGYADFIDQLIKQHEIEEQKGGWRKYQIPNMKSNLENYKTELINKSKIETTNRFIYIDQFLIIKNSYYGSLYSEIFHLLPELTYAEAINLSTGKLNLNKLKEALPNRIKSLKEYYSNFIKSSPRYSHFYPIIDEALKSSENKLTKGTNLLLITCIEGLVRELASYLNVKQNLNLDLQSDRFNSIDSLIRNESWKEDFKEDYHTVKMLDNSSNFETRPIIQEQNEYEKYVLISIKIRLGYLRRRFKDNRDLILHGQNTDYDNTLNTFFNLSSLNDVIRVIMEYEK